MLEKYQRKLNIKERIESPMDIILSLIDVRECSKGNMPKFYLEQKTEQMYYSNRNISDSVKREEFLLNPSLDYGKKINMENIDLTLYEVIKNEKSMQYYRENFDSSNILFFNDDKVIYVVIDQYLGLADTNSNLLLKNYLYSRGVIKDDLKDQTFFLWEHLISFEM